MFSTALIQRRLDELTVEAKQKDRILNQRERQIYDFEVGLLSGSLCPIVDKVNEGLISLDQSKIKDTSTKQYYNSQAMTALTCSVNSMVYLPPISSGLQQSDKIRRWFDRLMKIGMESNQGVALTEYVNKTKDLIIIKANKDPNNPSLTHELFVGFYGINQLRKIIPNFSMLLGGFKCSPPVIDPKTNKVVNWCMSGGKQIQYVMYEYIYPSVSFVDYIQTATIKQFLSGYLQVLYSLKVALKTCDFTHYDLHTDNILMREVENKLFQIEYPTENGIEYIEADRVATFIDYGSSHIKYMGNSVGETYFYHVGINPDYSNLMYDAYKLLMSLGVATVSTNPVVFEEVRKIFTFFNTVEPLEQAIDLQYGNMYAFPYIDLSIDELIKFIRTNCDCSFITPRPHLPIETCTSSCLTLEETLLRAGFTEKVVPTNLFDFYDQISDDRKDDAEVERLASVFDYDKAMRETRMVNEEQIERLNQVLVIDLARIPKSDILKPETMKMVRQMLLDIYTMRDVRYRLNLNSELMEKVSQFYDKTISLDEIYSVIDQIDEQLSIYIPIAIQNDKIIDAAIEKYDIPSLMTLGVDWYSIGRVKISE